MKGRLVAGVVAAVFLGFASSASATTYEIDKSHTTVAFKIRHLFSFVQGSFRDFSGQFEYTPGSAEGWKAEATVQTTSIDTNVAERDKHLRTADFFDVEKFPTMTFKSTEVTDVTATSAKLHGILTLHGVEKPVVLDVTIHGEGKDPWGNMRSGFSATTTINRKDFGLTWNKAVETGQLLVGEEVQVILEVEGIVKS